MEQAAGERLGRFYSEMTSLEGILAALSAAGVPTDRMRPADLYERGFDCQNLGGFRLVEKIAAEVAKLAAPGPSDRILDVGCGIGGPGRFLADRFGCRVLGVDLVATRVEVARNLAARTGLAERVEYRAADATALPAESGSLAQVWMLDASIHVRAKARLFVEIARVLRAGGLLVLHDQLGPLPRAMQVVRRRAPYYALPLDALVRQLEAADFRVLSWQETTPHVLAYFQEIDRKVGPRERGMAGGFLEMLDAYLEALGSAEGRTGLLVARREESSSPPPS